MKRLRLYLARLFYVWSYRLSGGHGEDVLWAVARHPATPKELRAAILGELINAAFARQDAFRREQEQYQIAQGPRS